MEKLHEPKSEALRGLFWRDEILQVMFWLRGEARDMGLSDLDQKVSPETLERFLGVDSQVGIEYLDRLVEEGLLTQTGGLYELTETGRQHGARVFAEEFSELTGPTHGECGPDCWCHASPDEAETCAAERLMHPHDHNHDH